RCLVRPSPRVEALSRLGVELVTGDVCHCVQLHDALRDCDGVFHLAAKTAALRREELFQTNAYGSFLIAQACAGQQTPPRLILVSSIAAAGTAIAGRSRREDDASRPVSNYGRS